MMATISASSLILELGILLVFVGMGVLANLVEDLRKIVQYLSAVVLLTSIMSLISLRLGFLTSILSPYTELLIILFISGMTTLLASQWDHEKEIEAQIRGRQIFIGKAVKSLATSLAILWFLLKLNLFSWVPPMFESVDGTLGVGLVLYIVGSGIESINAVSASSAVRGFFSGLAISSILILILSYILMIINLVSGDWNLYHSAFINLTLVSIVMAVIIHLVLPHGVSPQKLGRVNAKKLKLRIMLRDESVNIGDRVTIMVPRETLVIPFTTGEFRGLYFRGPLRYEASVDFKNIAGRASEIVIVARKKGFEEIFENSDELEREDFIYMGLDLNEVANSINTMLKEIGKEEEEKTIVEMPMLKIREGKDFDYVKVGPVVVYDSPEGSLVKVGPLKIVEGGKISPPAMRYTYVVINDAERGLIRIGGDRDSLWIRTRREFIEVSNRYKMLKTKGKKIVIRGEKKILKINGTTLILHGNRRAIIKKPDRKIVADTVTGTVIIESPGKGKKVIRDRDQALATIKRVNETISKVLETTVREPEISEVKDLISYLDRLLHER